MKLQKIICVNPGKNYQKIGEIDISTTAEIAEYVRKARKAQPAWAALALAKRIAILEKIYQTCIAKRKDIALIIAQEIGMPITTAQKVDIEFGLIYLRGYMDFASEWLEREVVFEDKQETHYVTFEPRGVSGVSIPWNYPFCNFIWGVIPNLIVGNTVVFKHAEDCPFTAQLLGSIMDSSELPQGVFSQVYGDGAEVGEALMNADLDCIYFTGSTRVGKHLYQVAANKFIPAMLELGGSAPGIVFEDADLEIALNSIYQYRFINNGQTCDGLKRLIVHRSLFETVVANLKKIVEQKKLGNPEDPSTDLGPLATQRQLIALEYQVADSLKKGAKIITGGKRPKELQGAYYEPTILTNISSDMHVWKEEVFGPVLPIVFFDTEQEAIDLANDSQYGLGGYIYTQDTDRAIRVGNQLKTGNVSINDANYVIAQDPFGGYKNSGLGREHGKQGLRELCNTKLIAVKK